MAKIVLTLKYSETPDFTGSVEKVNKHKKYFCVCYNKQKGWQNNPEVISG